MLRCSFRIAHAWLDFARRWPTAGASEIEIHTIDLGFQNTPQAIAAYLVVGPKGPVLIEAGPASTIRALKAGLAEHGYTPADIRHVLLTHIHLDHAGAAGWWALQGANVYVHHVGAAHLADPSKLLKSAERIYGDEMNQLWGETLPAPLERVRALQDGDRIDVSGLTFIALDTPGHANHHMVYQLNDIAFTGDVAAVRLPSAAFISLPAPPPEFDLDVWRGTLALLRKRQFSTLYPTHFGPVHDVEEHLEALSGLLEESTEFVRVRIAEGLERDALAELYVDWVWNRARAHGLSESEFQARETPNPSRMSVDGIMRYWKQRAPS